MVRRGPGQDLSAPQLGSIGVGAPVASFRKEANERIGLREFAAAGVQGPVYGAPRLAGRFRDRAGSRVGPSARPLVVGVGPSEDLLVGQR